MFTVSTGIRTAINKGIRSGEQIFSDVLLVGSETFTDEILSAQFSYTWPSSDTPMYSVGQVLSKTFTARLHTTVDFSNATILYFQNVTDGTESVSIPMFSGRVTSCTVLDEYVEIEAHDCIYFIDSAIYTSSLTYPCDIATVMGEILDGCGLGMETFNFPTFNLQYAYEGYNYRQVIGKIAELVGANVSSSRTGKIEFFVKNETNIEFEVDFFHELKFKDPMVISSFSCQTKTTRLFSGTSGLGPAISNINMTQERLDIVKNDVVDSGYYGTASCKFVGDPTLDLGDVIKANDNSGTSHRLITMGQTQVLGKGFTSEVESFTSSTAGTLVQHTSISQKLAAMNFDIDGLHVSVSQTTAELGTLSSQFEVLAGQITLKVSSDDIVNQINLSTEGLKIDVNKVDISSLVTISSLEDPSNTTKIDGCTITCSGSYEYTNMGESTPQTYNSYAILNSGRLTINNGEVGVNEEYLNYGWEGISTGIDPNSSTGGVDFRSNIFPNLNGTNSYHGATLYALNSPSGVMSGYNACIIAPNFYDNDPTTGQNPDSCVFSMHIRNGYGCIDYGTRTPNTDGTLFNYYGGVSWDENGHVWFCQGGNGNVSNLATVHASNIPLEIVSANLNVAETVITTTLNDGSHTIYDITTDATDGITFTKRTS